MKMECDDGCPACGGGICMTHIVGCACDVIDRHIGTGDKGREVLYRGGPQGMERIADLESGRDEVVCPKCGSTDGWNGPRYKEAKYLPGCLDIDGVYIEERLIFACKTCGYERSEETEQQKRDRAATKAAGVQIIQGDEDRSSWWERFGLWERCGLWRRGR